MYEKEAYAAMGKLKRARGPLAKLYGRVQRDFAGVGGQGSRSRVQRPP